MTDLEIANKTKLFNIIDIAKKLNISEEDLELYGKYKAKLSDEVFEKNKNNSSGKLILVTATNPTPAGEGKTTVTIGLSQALNKLNKKSRVSLREPSLGPVFGIKGGATGGGYSQVLPMDEINLHFTGDMHAITSANNLLCAMIDNHIHHGNLLQIDPRRILIKRCLDMNDRALRDIVIGLGGKINGMTREDGFIITVASEIMAILCLSSDIHDLKNRLGNILIAYNYNSEPVYARDLKAHGSMTVLLQDAIKPNLVQTTEHTPAIIHGGPFANIAHGCSSLRATKLALKLSDYCVTEAGFGADLGAEKFLDIKCRVGNLKPDCIVLVTTIRTLKYNGGMNLQELKTENIELLKNGLPNLGVHIENLKKYNIPVVVTLNKFDTDTQEEIEIIRNYCESKNCDFAVCDIYSKGGEGGVDLANKIIDLCSDSSSNNFKFLYDNNLSIKDKISKISSEIYRAKDVIYTSQAEKSILEIEKLGNITDLPVCIAKTQYSLSDNPKKLCVPENFEVTVQDVYISNGAGFIVVIMGNIMRMPGLPKIPSAEKIDITPENNIIGLF